MINSCECLTTIECFLCVFSGLHGTRRNFLNRVMRGIYAFSGLNFYEVMNMKGGERGGRRTRA